MAKAKLDVKIITPAVAEVSETVITLELNPEEAQYLRDVVGSIYTLNGRNNFARVNSDIFAALVPYTKLSVKYPFEGRLTIHE